VAVASLLAGCGIRTTTVPVDDGPAPSRVACAAPSTPATPEPDAVLRKVYLVCNTQVTPVTRGVLARGGRGDRYGDVRELLAQLQISPRTEETRAGFSTAVPGTLEIAGPGPSDPGNALRLNAEPDELPSFALAQIVCTLAADPAVAPQHEVVLGGPSAAVKLRSYTCTSDLRTRSEAADGAGTAVK
jgi:hypothetical protein